MMAAYLGDGVYIEPDQGRPDMLRLYTSNGIDETNTIFLEPEVADALRTYLDQAARDWHEQRRLAGREGDD